MSKASASCLPPETDLHVGRADRPDCANIRRNTNSSGLCVALIASIHRAHIAHKRPAILRRQGRCEQQRIAPYTGSDWLIGTTNAQHRLAARSRRITVALRTEVILTVTRHPSPVTRHPRQTHENHLMSQTTPDFPSSVHMVLLTAPLTRHPQTLQPALARQLHAPGIKVHASPDQPTGTSATIQ